jgi:hypothetical protein
MKGRGDGMKELDEAAHYLAQRFKKFGLQPAGDGGTYLQHFTITVGAKLGPDNSLAYESGATRKSLTLERDFVPFSFSESLQLQAPLVFAGYGITAPEFNYDDYKGIDAQGKIVLVLRHEPQENDERSVFAGKQLTTHAEIVNKAINARNHGAAGMILVNDLGNHPGQPDELFRFGTLIGPEEMKLAALQVKAALVDEWLKASGKTLEELRQAIDKDLSNHSFALDPAARLALSVDVQRTRRQVANVVGRLTGQEESSRSSALWLALITTILDSATNTPWPLARSGKSTLAPTTTLRVRAACWSWPTAWQETARNSSTRWSSLPLLLRRPVCWGPVSTPLIRPARSTKRSP